MFHPRKAMLPGDFAKGGHPTQRRSDRFPHDNHRGTLRVPKDAIVPLQPDLPPNRVKATIVDPTRHIPGLITLQIAIELMRTPHSH
ncbi:unnamed protein product [Linum trigynum]|uniref:Uncharacterized protein n=1 Tax=Linum trigynum TaxID=586398 RepID=A0AAV2FDW4_9ROSI